ncbi:hypothetical protein AA106555_0165 [Neokomagataea thailandica NBRC 106555]|uniref:Transposase n=1 Tax=Neokomagataea thailandica NBRC 106555 TaxID=1223520 RepID=A0ABQ0QMC1_9PROT|nr:hypothetical protein AA106555_0165 [Neokomagataea thailandica NBRC 106555]
MRGDNDGCAERDELSHGVKQKMSLVFAEGVCWLVSDKEGWPANQGAGDCHTLLLAAGEL